MHPTSQPSIIQENVSLSPLTTFQVGGLARYFARVSTEAEMLEVLEWAQSQGIPSTALGGGSNLLVPDVGFPGLVIALALRGITRRENQVQVAAGENWDELVGFTVADDLAGMECLAGIPGSVGATPIQNVGAYGQEVSETISSVRAYDRQHHCFVELTAAECRFRYRGSLFNADEPGRFLVTRVTFELRPAGKPELRYADLKNFFAGHASRPSLPEVAEAVRSIRRGKGMVIVPGDADTRSAGSYFKNAIVPTEELSDVADLSGYQLSDIPRYPAQPGHAKLPAAWLVERAGFGKGFQMGRAGLSTRHTLALTNRGGATCAEILSLEDHIRTGVLRKFGVLLDREPILLQPEVTML